MASSLMLRYAELKKKYCEKAENKSKAGSRESEDQGEEN